MCGCVNVWVCEGVGGREVSGEGRKDFCSLTHSCGHPSRHPSECDSGGERDRERKKCHSQRNGGTLSARN